jgi:hypothetical protein
MELEKKKEDSLSTYIWKVALEVYQTSTPSSYEAYLKKMIMLFEDTDKKNKIPKT